MRRRHLAIGIILTLLLHGLVQAQVRHEINFPDLPGYQTLKCDFHMHSIFSDGNVWPTVRADEAWRIGLDVISLTDHIEYQPHKANVPTNHNRPYELASGRARERNLLFPRGAEITRDTPPGHFNAIFLKDVVPLETEDFVEVIKRANEQGAFVFWNHQGWKGSEKGRWIDVHTLLYKNKWLHGMEVCNGESYYPDAHQWCLEKGLTMLGNSDIHAPDLLEQNTASNHRTLTLVFVKDRTLEGLQEALVEGRTVVWYQDQLVGKKEWLEPLFKSSVRVLPAHAQSGNTVWVQVRNDCSADIKLERNGETGPMELLLPARTVSLVRVSIPRGNDSVDLQYKATNFLVAPGTALTVTLQIEK